MTTSEIKRECEALKTIRGRWQLRGWKFTPLERIDGLNETLESIDALRDSPVCWSNFSRGHNIAELLEDLEDSYRLALKPWAEHQIVFDCKAAQREFLRWPEGTFSAWIQRDARNRYWELVTTSRFSVNAVPCTFALQCVNWPSEKITIRHIASLAAMVCIIEAIQSLEQIEDWWREDSRPYRVGKPFDWLSKNDPKKLEIIISVMLETPGEIEPHNQQIQEARKTLEQANRWLEHLATMNLLQEEVQQSIKFAKAARSEKARTSARSPRGKAKQITAHDVADYVNANPEKRWKTLQFELIKKYGASAATLGRRKQEAKKEKLIS